MNFKIFLALLLGTGYVTQAQNQLIVTRTNGQTDAFAISDIRSIKFANNTMNLTRNDGTQNSWPIADISQYAFSNATSAGRITESEMDQAKIFPNPASGNLHIEYRGAHEGRIAIELLDLHGKVLRTVYNGIHQGISSCTTAADLPGGVYICRIASEQKIISKPFVIQ